MEGSSAVETLNKSFTLAVRSLLTACSKQDICKAFPSFGTTEQEHLHRLFIQVVTSLHVNIEEEFESLCRETQVETALDVVEQLVEEQALNPLLFDETTVGAVAQNVSMAKKNEIQHLKIMLQKAEEQNQLMKARVEVLRKGMENASVLEETVEKLRRASSKYGTH